MEPVHSNQQVLNDYTVQWEALERELESVPIDEKTKVAALVHFREMKESISQDLHFFRDQLPYAGFVAHLSSQTTTLAQIVTDAKVHDVVFNSGQTILSQKEAENDRKTRFSIPELLAALEDDGEM
jgi:hypothetical protein